MAGGTCRYDLADLEAVAGGLTALAAGFEVASRTRDGADGALGYGHLRDALREFVGNGSHERGKQLEEIRGSATALTEVVGGYVEHDDTADNCWERNAGWLGQAKTVLGWAGVGRGCGRRRAPRIAGASPGRRLLSRKASDSTAAAPAEPAPKRIHPLL